MKFSSKEDIEVPIEAVFDMVSDFDSFESRAARRGVEVRRTDMRPEPGAGMTWQATFEIRGKQREVALTLNAFDPPTTLVVEGVSRGMTGQFDVGLLALSRARTRIAVQLDVKPTTVKARLLIQSLRLAKGRLTARFKARVAEYARELEERHRRRA